MMDQVGHSERWISSTHDIKEWLRLCSTMIKIIFWLRSKDQMNLFLCSLRVLIYKTSERGARACLLHQQVTAMRLHVIITVLHHHCQELRASERYFLDN